MTPTAILDYRFIAPATRPALEAFERFTQVAAMIADDTARAPQERLDALEFMAEGEAPGGEHAHHVLQACQKAVITDRFRSWSELSLWCAYAAAPAGRYVAELHGEPGATDPAMEALYNAIRILHCVRDCKEDFVARNRVYLPGDWMRRAGVEADALDADAATPGLRDVLDRTLDGADRLLRAARAGRPMIRDRRLRRAVAIAIAMAERHAGQLRRRDPLSGHIALGGLARGLAGIEGRLATIGGAGRGPVLDPGT